MTAQTFPVQDSTLSSEALIQDLIPMYALPQDSVCRFYRKGICDTYRVIAGEQCYFLKVYRNKRRTHSDVSEEVRLLLHLASDGVSVAEPVARTDGRYVNEIHAPEGKRFAVLFRAATGESDDRGSLNRIKALGEMVGRMHRSCDSFRLPYNRTPLDMGHLVDENLTVIATIMQHRTEDLALIRSVGEECRQIPLLAVKKTPQYGVCHGDLHGGDVAYDRHNRPTIYDFDSSGCGWRAFDIGVFPASVDWMDTSTKKEAIRKRRLDAFLDGYSRIRSLADDEIFAVKHMAPIRHIYLMGFVLRYTAIWNGNYWADDHFIDWHMKWFNQWCQRSKDT